MERLKPSPATHNTDTERERAQGAVMICTPPVATLPTNGNGPWPVKKKKQDLKIKYRALRSNGKYNDYVIQTCNVGGAKECALLMASPKSSTPVSMTRRYSSTKQ